MARPRSVYTEDVLEAIPRWVNLGASTEEIADAIGTTVGSLCETCSRHGILLSGSVPNTLSKGLRSDKWLRLRQEAVDRGIPVTQLIRDLIEAIIDDDMFTAVLDDSGG